MTRRLLLAASVIILAVAAFSGCSGDGGGSSAANVAGRWTGTLAMAFVGPTPTSTGALTLDLSQENGYTSGIATWTPVGTTQGIAGALDGDAFTFLLHFSCTSKNGGVTLTGKVVNEVMTVTGGNGIACFGRTPVDVTVAGAVGTLTRTSNNQPL